MIDIPVRGDDPLQIFSGRFLDVVAHDIGLLGVLQRVDDRCPIPQIVPTDVIHRRANPDTRPNLFDLIFPRHRLPPEHDTQAAVYRNTRRKFHNSLHNVLLPAAAWYPLSLEIDRITCDKLRRAAAPRLLKLDGALIVMNSTSENQVENQTNLPPATETQISVPEIMPVVDAPGVDIPEIDEPVQIAPSPDLLDSEELPPIDPEDVVEAAEELLREAAPHDFDVLIVGGGPGGYVAAARAAQLGAHVGLIEERELGGVCLNRGCIPTKTLLESVDVLRLLRRAKEYGVVLEGGFHPDFAAMNARKKAVVEQMREEVAHLLETNNVEVIAGRARFVDEHCVEVTAPGAAPSTARRRVVAVHIIIATGSVPQRLPVPGHDLPGVITSDELLQLETVPQDIVVAGAGAVGVEFAYLYRALGARSTLLEMAPTIMPQEDADIGQEMARILQEFGVSLLTESKLERIEQDGDKLKVVYSRDNHKESIPANLVLMATGRRANTDGLGIDEIGIKNENGCILVDEHCETSVSGVYAIGDCIRDVGWAHQASGEGTMVAEIVTKHPVTIDMAHVPSCYYTHPEIASVGLTQAQAKEKGIPTSVGVFHFRANGRAAAAGDHDGFVKVVVGEETDKLLGCQIIGPRATDLISEAVLALKTEQTVAEMVGAIHAHPTFSEALPEALLSARSNRHLAD
jgi:dihydrolipoamide dehydrogenase